MTAQAETTAQRMPSAIDMDAILDLECSQQFVGTTLVGLKYTNGKPMFAPETHICAMRVIALEAA